MGIMVYFLLWVMQDFDHQPYDATVKILETGATWNPRKTRNHKVSPPPPDIRFIGPFGSRGIGARV